jgi:hypothetical protein
MWKPIILVFASMALSLLPAHGQNQGQKTTNDLQNSKDGKPTTSGLETQTPQHATTTNLGGQAPTQPTTNNLQQPPQQDNAKPATR